MDDEQAPAAPAGWFATDDGRERYWDGSRWTDAFRKAEAAAGEPVASDRQLYGRSPAGLIGSGVVLCVFGAIANQGSRSTTLDGSSSGSGNILYVIGGALLLVGIIAYGVRIGRRD